jgi:hypothetical protein
MRIPWRCYSEAVVARDLDGRRPCVDYPGEPLPRNLTSAKSIFARSTAPPRTEAKPRQQLDRGSCPRRERASDGRHGEYRLMSLSPELIQTSVRARRRETISRIATRLGLKTAELDRWNAGNSPKMPLSNGQKVTAFVRRDVARSNGERQPGGRPTLTSRST